MNLNKTEMAVLWLVIATVGAMGQVTGSGTTNQVAKFTGATAVGNSAITEANGNVGIGTTQPQQLLHVGSTYSQNPAVLIGGSDGNNSSTGAYALLFGAWRDVEPNMASGVVATPVWTCCSGYPSGGYAGIRHNNLGLYTFYDPANPSNYAPQLYIDGSSSNVGLGTTSPVSKLHLGVGNGDGITIGNPSDPLGNGGTYAIKFYGYRDMTPNVINAKITAERTDACCGWLAQGLDLAFYTTNSNVTANADNSVERMRIKDDGNVGIGTTSPGQRLEVNGGMKLTSGSGGSITYADGTTQTTAWTGALCGGDYAESVGVSGERTQYEPGDVLVIDPANPEKFLKSSVPYSATVAGIYSTKPGVTGRRTADPQKVKTEIPMAMVGIVPTKVTAENGPIRVGDLLVTSSAPGYAMKGIDRGQMLGAVLGKALGPLSNGTGVINVLVTLQ